MRKILYAAVHKDDFGTKTYLFWHDATPEQPVPPSGEELRKRLLADGYKCNYSEHIDTEFLIASPVENPEFLVGAYKTLVWSLVKEQQEKEQQEKEQPVK